MLVYSVENPIINHVYLLSSLAMFGLQDMSFRRRNAQGNLTLHIFSFSIFFLRKDENSVFISIEHYRLYIEIINLVN